MPISIPTLYAAQPLSISATFDKIWIKEIVISSPTVGGEAEARVTMQLFRTTEDGVVEESPSEPLRLHVKDLISGAEADPDLENAVAALISYVAKVGVEKGFIA